MIFVGFTVLEGKVQSPSQAQNSVWQHMMGSVDNPRLGGFFPIDLGAPAAPNVVEDSPPSEIQLEVKRGLDVGTAIISEPPFFMSMNSADCPSSPCNRDSRLHTTISPKAWRR